MPKKPTRCFLYRYFDKDDILLYVGISDRPDWRDSSHRHTAKWYGMVVRMEHQIFSTRAEAKAAESQAIVEEAPLYNRAENLAYQDWRIHRADIQQRWTARGVRRQERAREQERERLRRQRAETDYKPPESDRLVQALANLVRCVWEKDQQREREGLPTRLSQIREKQSMGRTGSPEVGGHVK